MDLVYHVQKICDFAADVNMQQLVHQTIDTW